MYSHVIISDTENRVFKFNNTGYEYSFYSGMHSGPSKSHPRWVGNDVESRISYFREDPGLSHWYAMFMARWATWLSPEKYPGVDFVKQSVLMFSMHKWLLNRYNLERMTNDLPFVTPFDWEEKVVSLKYNLYA